MLTTLAPGIPTLAVKRPSILSTLLIVTCGIVLPVVAVLMESLMHFCAMGYIDPLPTVGHVFALATVPLANGFALWALHRRDGSAHLDAIIFAQAFAVAVAGAYTLLFLPVTQLALLAVAFWAYGLLLAPALSLFASLRALVALCRLRRARARPARRMVRGGLAAGVFTLLLLAIPAALTRAPASRLVDTLDAVFDRTIGRPDY